ncbi:MAG: hypothetical protein ACK4GD_11675 [Sphingomonadaceae bacterium]
MAIGEYIILFAAILVGLAVADLALSLHRLLRAGRTIRWTPLVPLLAFLVLCLVLNMWWALFRNYTGLEEISFVRFLPEVAVLLALFLLSASALPDKELEPGSDLAEWHRGNRSQFWGMFAVYLLLVIVNVSLRGIEAGWSLATFFERNLANFLLAVAALAAIRLRKMWFDYLLAVIWIVLIGLFWANLTLD